MAAGDIDDLSNTHGFWMVWSVESSNIFTIKVPNNLTGGCTGTAYFFPVAINVNAPSQQNDRGWDSLTVNCSNCPSSTSNTDYSDYPPLGIQMSAGNRPIRNTHAEGYRVGMCIGCFAASDNQTVENYWPNVNMHTGLIISNQFPVTRVNIQNLRANISGGGNVTDTGSSTCHNIIYTLIDYPNGNKITCANNPIIVHYWTDAVGMAHFEGGNCADMTKGWCNNNGVWMYYQSGIPAGQAH